MGSLSGSRSRCRQHGQLCLLPHRPPLLPWQVERPSRFAEESYPEWIVIRRDWLPPGFLESAYFHTVQRDYERIELDAPDVLWQNREDPGSHHFRTVTGVPRVVMFRKPKGPDEHA